MNFDPRDGVFLANIDIELVGYLRLNWFIFVVFEAVNCYPEIL